jgi:hypothetical protein
LRAVQLLLETATYCPEHPVNPEFQPGQLCVAGVISTVDLETGSAIARIYGRFERLESHGRKLVTS